MFHRIFIIFCIICRANMGRFAGMKVSLWVVVCKAGLRGFRYSVASPKRECNAVGILSRRCKPGRVRGGYLQDRVNAELRTGLFVGGVVIEDRVNAELRTGPSPAVRYRRPRKSGTTNVLFVGGVKIEDRVRAELGAVDVSPLLRMCSVFYTNSRADTCYREFSLPAGCMYCGIRKAHVVSPE